METFATPGLSDPFRTPDGRLVNGRASERTREQYQGELLEHFMANGMGTNPVGSNRRKANWATKPRT